MMRSAGSSGVYALSDHVRTTYRQECLSLDLVLCCIWQMNVFSRDFFIEEWLMNVSVLQGEGMNMNRAGYD
jgi:hypothetical protein